VRILTVTRLSILVAILIAALRLLAPPLVDLLDLKVLDFRHLVRGPLAPGGHVVVVGIDEASLAEVGRWPWPRSRVAALVDRLAGDGAAVIGFDVVFDQPDAGVDLTRLDEAVATAPERPARELLAALKREADNDARLAEAFRRSGRVVLGGFFEFAGQPAATLVTDVARVPELSVRAPAGTSLDGVPHLPRATRAHVALPALAAAAAAAGHVNVLPDADGLPRRVPIGIRVEDRLIPSFGLMVVRTFLGARSATVTLAPGGISEVRVGDRSLHVDAAGQLWVNYLGPPHTIPHVSAADVLAGRAPRAALDGKIVLVGFTAAGFDEIATPFAPVVSGIELQATAIDNVLQGTSLTRPWWVVPAEVAVILVVGVIVGLLLDRLPGGRAVTAAAVLAVAYAWATQRLFVERGLALGAVYPLGAFVFCTLGGAVYKSLVEEGEKRRVRHAFRHYLNPEVIELVAQDPERLRLGGERRNVTLLFSDVRDFTGIAESLAPEAVGELLNTYLGAMTEIVFRHAGLLDKYIGDAVMAFWGAPVAVADHAARCCRAALDMVAALEDLHRRWREVGLPLLEIRIGIDTGDAVVGNFGSAERFSYTAMGDHVNLASRLEGLNKLYGTRILVSDQTRRAIGEEFVCREIDLVRVKGRAQAVAVHELLGRRADHDDTLARRAATFTVALADYRRRAWSEAIARLEALAAEDPADGAVGPFLDRCRHLRSAPPGEGWDAVSESLVK
jgi:adenylate cyclase